MNNTITTSNPISIAGKNINLPGTKISKKKALTISICITIAVMFIEILASYITNSLMLFSDGLHMLSHALSLGISLAAIIIATRKVTNRYPFGLGRVEAIAALVNGLGLALFTLYIFYESTLRIIYPLEISVSETIGVAILGLLVNLATAWILYLAGLEDLNTKSAFLHLLADTFSSVAIIIGCIVISFTDWYIIDPILSIIVGIVIAKWALGLIRDATQTLLHKVPDSFDLEEIERTIVKNHIKVKAIENLKIWELSNNQYCCIGTLQIAPMSLDHAFEVKQKIKEQLKQEHSLHEVLIELQVEN
ncbi:cation diffusion facilitator family transporter [Fulvivirgaceae bacterium BMA10]|uniref:Cation diffusion facilitator family transporter n=1 Tax=Splendidivirga corallicola TaxID=3051826 RepID=A0ABT8KR36_9BACT|nr:cation diffusion facilitator family transporter [Fulvivirgaceae bacterium BMA10]